LPAATTSPPTTLGALPSLLPSLAGHIAVATAMTGRFDEASRTGVKGTNATAGGAVAAAPRPPATVASGGCAAREAHA